MALARGVLLDVVVRHGCSFPVSFWQIPVCGSDPVQFDVVNPGCPYRPGAGIR